MAAPGDFALEGPGLRILVGGWPRDEDLRGAVLEVMAGGVRRSESPFVEPPWLFVGGERVRVRVTSVYLAAREDRPAIRIEGVAQLEGRIVRVRRDVTAGRVPDTVALHTSMWTLAPAGLDDVRLSDRVHWGGDHPFVPGVGAVSSPSFRMADWLGGDLSGAAVLLAPLRGRLSVRAVPQWHGGAEFLQYTELAYDAQDLAPGRHEWRSTVLSLSSTGLGEAVRQWGWAANRRFEEHWVHLPYRPAGAQVRVDDAQGRPWLVGRPDHEGRVVLPLAKERIASGQLRLSATAYGHASSRVVPVDRDTPRSLQLRIPRGGHVAVTAVDAGTDQPLPVRVRFVALEDGQETQLGPDHRAAGAGDTLVASSGRGRVALPTGRYRVWVTHGPEWSLHEQEVEVTETFGPRVDARLRHEVNPGEWIAADLHLHAAPSPDSEVSLYDRVQTLLAEGVRFAVPTDHNHVTSYDAVLQLQPDADLTSVTGVEVTTWEPAFGHFNAFPYPLDPHQPSNGAPPYQGLTPTELFEALHQVEPRPLVQVNHPRLEGGIGYFDVAGLDPARGWGDDSFSANFELLEVLNGFDLSRPEHTERVFQDWLQLLSHGMRFVATGSSDSHKVRYQLAGYPRTYIRVPDAAADDSEAVLQALRDGHVFVSSGPFLEVDVGGHGPGDEVQAERGSVPLHVRVRAPGWMSVERLEVFVGTRRVVDVPLTRREAAPRRKAVPDSPPWVRFDRTLRVAVEQDDFIVVRVSSSESIADFFGRWGILPVAFTNPIFVDADGDGRTRWSAPPAPLDAGIDAAIDADAGDAAADRDADANRGPAGAAPP